MSTVSLQMIVKDEYESATRLMEEAEEYFDQINVTVSDKPTANKIKKIYKEDHFNVVWREWTEDFAAARNANFAMSTTNYAFWVDADDTFDFSTIPELVKLADEHNIDAVFLPYNYAQNNNGESVAKQPGRERLIRNGKGYEWRGAIHEVCVTDQPHRDHRMDAPEVIHNTSPEHAKESMERNHKILVSLCEGKKYSEVDPRYVHYLGMSYFSKGDYEKCIEILTEFLKIGGSLEDSYRALSMISEAAYHMGDHASALEYASKCLTMKPSYPMGYYLLAQYESDQDNWEEALEWVKVALTKPDPDTMTIYDPTARERCVLIGAQAEFMLGHYNSALAYLRKIPHNEYAKDLIDDFTEEADAETFTAMLPKIRKFFTSDFNLWAALEPEMRYDTRVKGLRNVATQPKKWSDNSIVIFCGQGYEEWGPHTLDKGMGGSEEAIVYLSRELVKLGYDVTVYAEAELDDIVYNIKGANKVHYRHWKEIDTRDEFNVFVAWRAPQFFEKDIKAKVKLADIHDVLPESTMKDYPDVTYLVKTAYHRSLTPKLPDDKFRVIGNGIKKEQFKGDEK